MPDTELIGRLGVWEGYQVVHAQRHEANVDGGRPRVWVELAPIPTGRMTCDGCGRRVATVHDVSVRVIRDLPLFDADTFIRMPRRRVHCPWCGPRVERPSWLHRYARMTRRLADSVVRLCQQLPIKHVAAFYGLGGDAVKDLDKAALEERLGPPDLDGLEVLAMDEFAIHKGQIYATVVVEPRRKRVLWVGPGRDRECLRSFFALLGPERAARIRAVAMDMHAAFYLEVQAQCPHAEVVFDLFHVVAGYGRHVLDRVRVDEANRLRHDKRARRVIKSTRWLLLRNRRNITKPADRIRLTGRLGPPTVDRVVPARRPQSHPAAGRLRQAAGRARPRHHRPCSLAPAHEPSRGHQQQDQGHQAHRLWPAGRPVLLPKDPRSVPRNVRMNRIFAVGSKSRVRQRAWHPGACPC